MTKREMRFDELVQLFVKGEELTNEQVLDLVRNSKQVHQLDESERLIISTKVEERLSSDPELLRAAMEEIKKREKK